MCRSTLSRRTFMATTRQTMFWARDENIPRDQMVCRAVKMVHDQIEASANPKMPLIWSEYNATYDNESHVTDSHLHGAVAGGHDSRSATV